MRFKQLVLPLLCAGLIGRAAIADPSRLMNDSDVLEAGDCELEIARQRRSFHAATNGPQRQHESERALQLDCGIGWRTELTTMWVKKRPHDGGREHNAGLEAKTLLLPRAGSNIGVALLYGVQYERAASGWRRNGQLLGLEATLQARPGWLLHAQLGDLRDRGARNNRGLWALGVEHTVNEQLELRLKLEGDDRGRPVWIMAMRLSIWPERAALTLSHAVGAGPVGERSLSAALSFEF